VERFSLSDDTRAQRERLQACLKSWTQEAAAMIAADARLTILWDSISNKACAVLRPTKEGYAAIQESSATASGHKTLEHYLVSGLRSVLGEGVVIKIVPDSGPEVQTGEGLNNCFFKTETTIPHDELRFRSPAEISVYDELKRRRLLFFPNAAAVLGGGKPEKREPDFLICNKGTWGILEVMGETYHTNAVRDHDRARLFKEHGLLCIEFYPAKRCMSDPKGVVDEFLGILTRH
jgi:hypothetical protein